MRILVTGKEGQVATSLRERGAVLGHEIISLSRSELDLAADPDVIAHSIVEQQPDAVISAAAYTADRSPTRPGRTRTGAIHEED